MNTILLSGYGSGRATVGHFGAEPIWEEMANNPSWMVFGGGFLFLAEERADGAAVCAYRQEGDGFVRTDRMEIPGTELCHLSFAPESSCILGACYGTGDIFSLRFDPLTGTFPEKPRVLAPGGTENRGTGKTRAHFFAPDREEKFAWSVDIAEDTLWRFDWNGGDFADGIPVRLPKGVGPRHLAFHPEKPLLYAVTEYSSEVFVIRMTQNGGEILQRVSALQPDFAGESSCSGIVITPDGRFLYAANRGADSIAVLRVKEDGSIEPASFSGCRGCWPRDIALLDGGKILGIANQYSGNAVLCALDSQTGAVGETVREFCWPEVSCIRELPV